MAEISIEVEKKEPEEKEYGKFDKWEVEDALRTLKSAQKIKADKELMEQVKKCAKMEIKAITSLDELKAKGNAMALKEAEEEY